MSITAVVVDTDDLFAIDVEFGAAPIASVEVNWPSIDIGVPGLGSPADLSGYLPLTGGTMTGPLGIGVAPIALLTIGDGITCQYVRDVWGSEDTHFGNVPDDCAADYRTRNRGTLSAPAPVLNGDYIYQYLFSGANGSGSPSSASISALVDGVVSVSNMPIALSFATSAGTGGGGGTERLRITSAGRTILSGPLTLSPLSSETPTVNGQLSFEATSNTQLKLKYKGSDGVVRSATLTLA
jgi:hypothetical protein